MYLCKRKQINTFDYEKTTIQVLKALVNGSVLERIELRTRGAQAYDIAKGEEYTVIIAFAKQSGRYYFIARDGRRFLASHYDRAEWLAGELLEFIANDRAAAMHAADQLKRSGSVLVSAVVSVGCEGRCEGKSSTLTPALTLETPISRALEPHL